MANTPNNGIPYVPENTQDPAAGLNLSLNVIDALIQTEVISMTLSTPPTMPPDGSMYVVGPSATSSWVGQENNVARYVATGNFWQFYVAGDQAKLLMMAGVIYTWSGTAWIPASGSAAGGTVTSVNVSPSASVSDVLNVTGGPVTSSGSMSVEAVDPGADRIIYWDSTDDKLSHLEVGSNLSITAGVLNATGGGGGGGGDVTGPASALADRIAVFNGTTGKSIKDGGKTIAEISGITTPVSTPTFSAGVLTINFGGRSSWAGGYTLTANVTSVVFTNLPPAGSFIEYELHITQSAAGGLTFTIPTSHRALGGSDTAIASAANSVTVLSASSINGGAVYRYAMQESA